RIKRIILYLYDGFSLHSIERLTTSGLFWMITIISINDIIFQRSLIKEPVRKMTSQNSINIYRYTIA
ncbi:unnamed protein product, partial [Heterotrigona itama]